MLHLLFTLAAVTVSTPIRILPGVTIALPLPYFFRPPGSDDRSACALPVRTSGPIPAVSRPPP